LGRNDDYDDTLNVTDVLCGHSYLIIIIIVIVIIMSFINNTLNSRKQHMYTVQSVGIKDKEVLRLYYVEH